MPTCNHSRHVIRVTQLDIDEGVANTSGWCPVNTAVQHDVKGALRAKTDSQAVRFTCSTCEQRLAYLSPPSVRQFTINFDAGNYEAIKPFVFTLENPVRIARRLSSSKEQRVPKPPVPSAASGTGRVATRDRRFGERILRVNQQAAAQ